MYIRTEKDGETVIAVADTQAELARMLNVTPSAVCHALKAGSKTYYYVPDEEEEEGED